MNMKRFFNIIIFFAVLSTFVSCDINGGGENIPPQVVTEGVYILNNGNYASNDASLSLYDPKQQQIATNVFENANNKKLGDLAQDMLVYGGKMYIAVYNSKVIFVTDRQGKIVKELRVAQEDGKNLSPRALIGYNGKIYATLYEGYLAQIDTVDYGVSLVKVGDNPEGLVAVDKKVYVANSGGMNFTVGKDYGNTISVVSVEDYMVEVATIQVAKNPTKLLSNLRGDIFLISMGDYETVPNTLQRIDPKSLSVAKITERPVTYMSMGSDNKLYYISAQYDENWNAVTSVGIYDTFTGEMKEDFLSDGSIIKNTPTSISVDPVSGDVYIGTSDYVSEGDMYLFSSDAKLVHTFGTGGLNPIGAFFVVGLK
jgi:hypothetical protein